MAGNANSGRRPAPTALTVLRGNPSKKRLNQQEPVPPKGEVTKPAGLSAAAGAVWDELAPVCLAMRTLTVADQRAFSTMCELQATFQAAASQKDGRALVFGVKQDREDGPIEVVIDAVLRLERETAAALRPYYELFGLTPVARARIVVPASEERPSSKWAGALS